MADTNLPCEKAIAEYGRDDELSRLRSELAAAQAEARLARTELDEHFALYEAAQADRNEAQKTAEHWRSEVERLTKERDAFETRIKKEACSIANAIIEINADDLESWKARAQSAEAELGKLREAAKLVVATPWGHSLSGALDALRALIEKEGA